MNCAQDAGCELMQSLISSRASKKHGESAGHLFSSRCLIIDSDAKLILPARMCADSLQSKSVLWGKIIKTKHISRLFCTEFLKCFNGCTIARLSPEPDLHNCQTMILVKLCWVKEFIISLVLYLLTFPAEGTRREAKPCNLFCWGFKGRHPGLVPAGKPKFPPGTAEPTPSSFC